MEMLFCSLDCWQAHVPGARHRDAWATEERAPTRVELEEREDPHDKSRSAGGRTRMAEHNEEEGVETQAADADNEVLIVVSKLKKYIKARSGMNTSDKVAAVLSEQLREACREAIRLATADGRRTVLERDFPGKQSGQS
jgi:histone H3/H4